MSGNSRKALLGTAKLHSQNFALSAWREIFRLDKSRPVEYMSTGATLFFLVGSTPTLRLVHLKGQ